MLTMDTFVASVKYPSSPLTVAVVREFWKEQFQSYKNHFIIDLNIVNWKYIFQLALDNINQERALVISSQSLTTATELQNKTHGLYLDEDPFQKVSNTIPFNVNLISFKRDIEATKMKIKSNSKNVDIQHRDYLYYGILDFVVKKKEKETALLLKNDYDNWKEELIVNCLRTMRSSVIKYTPNDFYFYTKKISKTKATTIKLKKSDEDYKYKKVIKELYKIQKSHFKYPAAQNEYTFIVTYFSKIITAIFDINKKQWYYKWGEWKLAASKDEDNMGKEDEDPRAVGSSIDSIICLKKLDLDISIIEISGPMWKEDYTHFLKDRIKIAVNLKKKMKSTLRKKLVLDDAKDLKFYGIQIYKNRIHVYCLVMPVLGVFCFFEVFQFYIPTNSATLPKDFPQYVKYLSKTLRLIERSAQNLVNYLTDNDLYESDDTQTCSLSPPHVSPTNKKKRKRASTTRSTSDTSR